MISIIDAAGRVVVQKAQSLAEAKIEFLKKTGEYLENSPLYEVIEY